MLGTSFPTRVSILTLVISSAAAWAGTAPGTAFTYQGQLKEGGIPANGPCDFVFRLFGEA